MKKVFIIICFFVFTVSNSQNFKYSKIYSEVTGLQPSIIKIKGRITVEDTLITIYTNGAPTAPYKVRKITDVGEHKIFKAIGLGEDAEIRMSLSNPKNPDKVNIKSFLLEMKDNFSGNYNKLMYYLEDE